MHVASVGFSGGSLGAGDAAVVEQQDGGTGFAQGLLQLPKRVGVSAAVLFNFDARCGEQCAIAVHHKDGVAAIGLDLFGDGHQAFDTITVDADLVFFCKDVPNLLLPSSVASVILDQQASALAVFAPEPSVHVGAYQQKPYFFSLKSGKLRKDAVRWISSAIKLSRKVDLPTFCIVEHVWT